MLGDVHKVRKIWKRDLRKEKSIEIVHFEIVFFLYFQVHGESENRLFEFFLDVHLVTCIPSHASYQNHRILNKNEFPLSNVWAMELCLWK